MSNVLASVGLNPFVSDNPVAPVDSPAVLAVLAWARRRISRRTVKLRATVRGRSEFREPALAPLNQQTNQQLADLAQTMLEADAIDNPKGTTAGITFFGQFIDHDLTLDNRAAANRHLSTSRACVNGRTFAFDLDSVYGGGPKQSPQLYDGDKFMIGTATDGVSPDLPRNPDMAHAILVEHRNDENLIIAQIHLSFLGCTTRSSTRACPSMRLTTPWSMPTAMSCMNDYLPQIVGQEAVNQALSQDPSTPGSTSRGRRTPDDPGGVLDGGVPVRPLPSSERLRHQRHVGRRESVLARPHRARSARWPSAPSRSTRSRRSDQAELGDRLRQLLQRAPARDGEDPALIGRAIDTQIAPSLFELPIPGAEATGSNVLAFRNLVRAKFYDMPSGEAIAEAMGVPVVGEPVFAEGTPLWFYILREAEMTTGGAELGPVGGGIVAEVFVDLLRSDGGTKRSNAEPAGRIGRGLPHRGSAGCRRPAPAGRTSATG